MKSYSVFYIEQKMEFEKFSCFFADFLRYRFGRIRVMSIGAEREYTPNVTRQICFEYQLTDFYMIRGFTERYFLTDYIHILENQFYFCKCARLLFLTFFIQNFWCKQLRKSIASQIRKPFDPSFSHIIAMQVHYLQKERNRFRSYILLQIFFWVKGNPELYVFISSQDQGLS